MKNIFAVLAASAIALTGLSSAQQATLVARTVTTTTTTRVIPAQNTAVRNITIQPRHQHNRHQFRRCRRVIRFGGDGTRTVTTVCKVRAPGHR